MSAPYSSVEILETKTTVTITEDNTIVEVIGSTEIVVVSTEGVQGAPGQGVPQGGTVNQILVKQSSTDYDTEWVSVSGDATIAADGELTLASTGVTPGDYTNVNLSVDEKGRILDIESGSPGGVTSVNSLSGDLSIVTGTTGSDFNIDSTGTTITLHIPTASATNRGALSSSDWSAFNAKQPAGNYITALTGDVTASGPGSVASTIASDAVTNAKLANMATQTIKGRTTSGSGDPEDLTATQATAILNTFVGDSGSGGTKGLVVAPATGDATKFLRGDATWATVATASITSINSDTTATQTLVATETGTNFTISDPGSGAHNFNLPVASATNTGKLSNTDWSTFNGKQNNLGFTPENVANKSTNGTLSENSDTLYPSQKAVKTYVDAGLATKVESVTSSNDHVPVDNTDPLNPVVGYENAIEISNAEFLALAAADGLIKGWYLITDVNDEPEQFLFQVTGDDEFVRDGFGKFYDPDYNNSDSANYSGVAAQTGIGSPPGQYGGVWNPDFEGTYLDNMVVIWNGYHWAVKNPPDFNGEPPDINTAAYILMEKSFPNVGYITQWNSASYNPTTNLFTKRSDNFGNVIYGTDIPLFQFGNSNFERNVTTGQSAIDVINNPLGSQVSDNFIAAGSALVASRNSGQIIGNSITGGSYINANDNKGIINYNVVDAASGLEADTNEGVIQVCSFRNGAYPVINLNNSVSVQECDFNGDLNVTLPADQTFSSCTMTKERSTFPATINVTGINTLDLTGIEYAGIVSLVSEGGGEEINEILFGSVIQNVTIKIDADGIEVALVQVAERQDAVPGNILLNVGSSLPLTKANGISDFVEFENQAFVACQRDYNRTISNGLAEKLDSSAAPEVAQDAVGAMIASVDFQYTDATPLLSSKSTVEIKVMDDATTITTGDGKYVWVTPSRFNGRKFIGVFATVTTVSSSGTPTVQIHNITDAVDVLSTPITIDVSEYTSDTAATPPVINGSNSTLATGDRIRIDVDVAGTGAKGLAVGFIIGV